MRALSVALVVAGPLAASACGSSEPADVIERETFIETYVDLRTAALHTDSSKLATADREAILAEHGVDEDDLLAFIEAHAVDLDFIRDVWNEVELRLDRVPEAANDR